MPENSKAVFLSYASQDAEAARKICAALRAADIEVWFDQSELRGGDAWDHKIRTQIKECALFLPVISANTQTRPEGYFRLEWKLAVDRSHLMSDDHPFFVPIVIDDTPDAAARVPARFHERQWTRLPRGEVTTAFCARVKSLLAGAQSEHSIAPAHAPPLSEARQLLDRARAITNKGDLSHAQLDAAADLCSRALQLDSTDAQVWTEAARVDLLFIHPYAYDRSDERRKRAQQRATRAIHLEPDSFQARVVQAAVFAHAGGSEALLAEAEEILRSLVAEKPSDLHVLGELAEVLREQKRFADAAALFEQAGEWEVAGWSHWQAGDFPAADAAVDRALAQKRAVSALGLKALISIYGWQDLDAAESHVNRFRPSELLADIPASIAERTACFRREPGRALEILDALPQDYLSTAGFFGPKAYLVGQAHELAGRPELAHEEWRAALALAQSRLAREPRSRELKLWVARLQAVLGNEADAVRALHEHDVLSHRPRGEIDSANADVHLLLGRREEVLAWLRAQFDRPISERSLLHAEVRFSPSYDPLRGDARFEKLLRDTLPAGAKPFDDAARVAMP